MIIEMEDVELFLRDWEVTKERIKHFDDVIIRLRLQGIPIALAIMSLGAVIYPRIQAVPIPIIHGSVGSLLFFAAGIYLIPVLALDIVHYILLLESVEHAIDIENREEFRGKIQITNKITDARLTKIHTWIAIVLYGVMILIPLSIGSFLWSIPS